MKIYMEDELLKNFELIPSSKEIVLMAPAFMGKYNLLSNDAIILAILKSIIPLFWHHTTPLLYNHAQRKE